jgi:hypothetical protein
VVLSWDYAMVGFGVILLLLRLIVLCSEDVVICSVG